MAAGENQKLKMLYLVKIFSEETDETHAITLQEIIDKLSAYGVNAERRAMGQDIELLGQFGLCHFALSAALAKLVRKAHCLTPLPYHD